MWGATPLDQLACRIMFRGARYEGDFTPPGNAQVPSLQYPGNAGGFIALNGPHNALDVTITVIRVHEAGEPGGFDDVADSGEHFGETGETEVRQSVARR